MYIYNYGKKCMFRVIDYVLCNGKTNKKQTGTNKNERNTTKLLTKP